MSDFDINQVRRVDGGLLLVFRELLRTRRASTVAELINRLASAAPGARFGIGHWDEEASIRALRRGEIDFALGRFGAARPGFTVEPLFEDEYCVAARRDHPRVAGAIDEAGWRGIGH